MEICLLDESHTDQLSGLAQRFGFEHNASHPLALVQTPQRLELHQRQDKKQHAVFVDFVSGALAWRRKFGGGRREALVKAVGVKGDYLPQILDATAGLGRDAFVLAAVGCRVQMLERNPVVAALLEDGLQRGYQDQDIGCWLRERLTLRHNASISDMDADPVQVVYLDPMFPHRVKSALVKKPMQLLQMLAGEDSDADNLLHPARLLAQKRVVVKRPAFAPPLANLPPQGAVLSKKHRFDIYQPLPRR